MTLQDALVAYQTYARAEGKSPKTVAWIVSSAGYFVEFLGPNQQDIDTITANDLRRFIIALRDRPKFAHHPYNKPQQAKLSSQSLRETYCRAIKVLFGFLKREGFIENDVMAKVKMPKVPEVVIPTFSEKEIAKLLSQTNRESNEGFRNYCLLLTLIDTGIRLSELATLTDTEEGFNRFRYSFNRRNSVPGFL
jgi:integrase/recombinase XerD